MAAELRSKYRSIVEEMFNRWTALRLAVEHGMHVENNGLQASLLLNNFLTLLNLPKTNLSRPQSRF